MFYFAYLTGKGGKRQGEKIGAVLRPPRMFYHGVKLRVWDTHVPPRPFPVHKVKVAVML
jgi:hypothetical protein